MRMLVILAATACAVLAKPTSFVNPCLPNPCGINADCVIRSGFPSCQCKSGSVGKPNPYGLCVKECENRQDCAQDQECTEGRCVKPVECKLNVDCPDHHACVNLKCADVCKGTCGENSDCNMRNHNPICNCPQNTTGDPFVKCTSVQKNDVCEPSPCGANTDCKVENERPVCTCKPGYQGNPILSCKHECQSDYDCSTSQNCRNLRCQSVCTPAACGEGANCAAVNHTASCTCPQNYLGDASTRCYLECKLSADCPDHLACVNLKCADTCNGVCGENADCTVKGHNPICSCPAQMTGDPFVKCRSVERSNDVCEPSPCGENAECKVENGRPVCTCKSGYQGNPLSSCEHECQSDNDCSTSQNCRNLRCQSVCTPAACSEGANCAAVNHTASCTCPQNYLGDASTRCYLECKLSADCPDHLACVNLKCADTCKGACGENADCIVQNHTPRCTCPKHMIGDPFFKCRPIKPDVCEPSPCGANTDCKVENGRPVCTCKSGYQGNPLSSCQQECQSDNDCSASQNCRDLRCQSVCTPAACGEGANCAAVNHTASCTCPQNYLGDASTRCYLECKLNVDCPDHLACLNLKCADTCKGACGENADCKVQNHTPTCSCPSSMTGNPFVGCTRLEIIEDSASPTLAVTKPVDPQVKTTQVASTPDHLSTPSTPVTNSRAGNVATKA